MNPCHMIWLISLGFFDLAFGACQTQTSCLYRTCDSILADQPTLTCSKLEAFNCDCSGCECNDQSGSSKVTTVPYSFKYAWYQREDVSCVGHLNDSLDIGEKAGTAYDLASVEHCMEKCAKDDRCEGFNYENSLCRYKTAMNHDHLIVQTGTTCYVYARDGVVPPSMLKSTTAGSHRPSPPASSPCKAKTGCMRMTCDEQIAKNPELTCSRLEQSYCDCSGCLCKEDRTTYPPHRTTRHNYYTSAPPRRTTWVPTRLPHRTPRETGPVRTRPPVRTTLRGSGKSCRDTVCGGDSHCVDRSDGFECYCAKGWIGGGQNKVCEDVNECAGVVCGGSESTCVDGINLYECFCSEGYSGGGINAVCTANHCTCANGVAGSGASCPQNGAAKCVSCNHGFSLQMDDTCIDLCAGKTCSGHGSCYAGKCYCKNGYTGSTCSDSPDPCARANCGAHGRCFGGDCFCEDFYTGPQCQTPPNQGGSVVVVHGRE